MKKIVAGLLTLFTLIITTQIVFATPPNNNGQTNNGQDQETCPHTAPWVKIDGLNDPTYVYQVPSGKKVVEWCYKASTTVIYGTDGTPSTTTVTVASTVTNQNGNVQDLSHASFKLEDVTTCTETVTCNDSCRAQSTTIQGVCGPVTCAPNAPALQQCPTTCHTDTQYVPDGQCGQTTCLPNNQAVENCPTQCGYAGGTVSNGQCGTIQCAPTQSCPTSSPEPSPTVTPRPTPTPTPSPTPTPTPGLGKQSKTAITDPVCVGHNFDAIMELFLDGKPVKDVQVKFIYNNEAKFAKTNAEGKASVTFALVDGQDVVKFEPEDGYPTQMQTILKSDSCQTPQVLGATTGKILGASTLAKTGVFEETVVNLIGFMGAGLTTVGSLLYVKKRN